MKLQKPTWINHDGNPIFSVDIHPSAPRFATGGQGADSMGRIVIWGMGTIEFEENPYKVPLAKFLCQLDHHSACVNCVRWSNKGKYLASGGDDRVIMIWELKGHPALTAAKNSLNQNCSFGKSAQEMWKPIFHLRGHTGDILDLAWSPDDRFLASASVDNKVFVWDALNFPKLLKEIQGHSSLVKGVAWDPVGSYLASQSDDQTLKVWRTSDWKLEHTITECFQECGGTTHVLRLDWSPDGSYLVSAHAMNCGGPTAQIVERDAWKTSNDFVGHRKAVVCVRFTRAVHEIGKRQQCFVALGSRDRAVSVWSTALKRPLVVLREAFSNSVMDLTWSSDGKMLMGCSTDGTVIVATFSKEEIGDPLGHEEMMSLYQRYYGTTIHSKSIASQNIVQNVEVFLARKNIEKKCEENLSIINDKINSENELNCNNENGSKAIVIRGPTDKQIETRTADGRRRITPRFLLPDNEIKCPAFANSQEVVFGEANSNCKKEENLRSDMVLGVKTLSETGLSASNSNTQSDKETKTPVINGIDTHSVVKGSTKLVQLDSPVLNGDITKREPCTNDSSTVVVNGTSSVSNGEEKVLAKPVEKLKLPVKRRRDSDESIINQQPKQKITKPSTEPKNSSSLANTQAKKSVDVVVKENNPTVSSSTQQVQAVRRKQFTPLKIADALVTKVQLKLNSFYQLEVSNGTSGSNWLKCQHDSSTLDGLCWAICMDFPICSAVGDEQRIVAACEDCTVHILDLKGLYVLPPFIIIGLPTKLCLSDAYLLIITVRGTAHVWDIHHNKSIIKSESILPLLNFNNSETSHIFHATIMPTGSPLVILSNGKKFSYSFDMHCWISILEASSSIPLGCFDKSIESGLTESTTFTNKIKAINKESSITEIKRRLATAIELERKSDVEKTLTSLAKTLAIKGNQKELHILCVDLLGPTHSSSSLSQQWDPIIAGVNKRKILRQILNSLLMDLKWQDFFMEFDDLLKEVETE